MDVRDGGEDFDNDNDQVLDLDDSCSLGDMGWSSNLTTDYDNDGCQDLLEDQDDDNDSVLDHLDSCKQAPGWILNSSSDYDSDGCLDPLAGGRSP